MGLLKDIIKTASPILDVVAEAVDKRVNNIAEAKAMDARKEELFNSISKDLDRDTYDNDRYQRKVERYIREYCSSEDDFAIAYYFKAMGWRKTLYKAQRQLQEMAFSLDDSDNTKTIQERDEAKEKWPEALQELENNLTEDNVQIWFCALYCLKSEWLHYMGNHIEAVRLAIQGLPYAYNDNEKEWAKSLISGKDYQDWQICSRDGGYGLIIDKTVEESVEFLGAKPFAFSFDKDSSIEDNEAMLEVCGEELQNGIQDVKDNFLLSLQPYHDRQFIFTVKDLDHIGGCYDETDNIKYVFPLDELPKDISFPLGHPQANTLYYAHPLRPVYLLFENAQLTLFYEKVQEMCRLFQCLGATRITARCLKGNKISSNVMTSYEVNAEGGYKVVSGSGGIKGRSGTVSDSESKNEMFMTQNFSPYKAPYCPKDLVWTKNDPELLSLIKQRMEGGLLDFTKRVSSYETSNMSQNLITDVKAAFQNLMANVSANYSASSDTTFSSTQETEWEISVEFKPLDELPKVTETKGYSESDLVMQIDNFVYMEDYERTVVLGTAALNIAVGQEMVICHEDSGFESVIEKIIISFKSMSNAKKGDKIGLILKGVNSVNIHKGAKIYLKHSNNHIVENTQITEPAESVEEVKTDAIPGILNPNEERYKEEVLFCLEDGGSISDDDRKYLERKRIKFDISAERAAEIESLCAPQLTDNEQEYLETFKELAANGITDRTSRLLERERETLNITKERAAEIEQMYNDF